MGYTAATDGSMLDIAAKLVHSRPMLAGSALYMRYACISTRSGMSLTEGRKKKSPWHDMHHGHAWDNGSIEARCSVNKANRGLSISDLSNTRDQLFLCSLRKSGGHVGEKRCRDGLSGCDSDGRCRLPESSARKWRLGWWGCVQWSEK